MTHHTTKHVRLFVQKLLVITLSIVTSIATVQARENNASYRLVITTVTAADYAAFLNSVASSDPHHLYDLCMSSPSGNIVRVGRPGTYSYTVALGYEHQEISFVSYKDQVCFFHWIKNQKLSDFLGTAAPSIFHDNSEEIDPELKISGNSFSIIAPEALFSSPTSTAYNPSIHAASEPEVITTLAEALEELFLIAGTCAGGETMRRSLAEHTLAHQEASENAASTQHAFETARRSYKILKYGERLQEQEKEASRMYKSLRSDCSSIFEAMQAISLEHELSCSNLQLAMSQGSDPHLINHLQQHCYRTSTNLAYQQSAFLKTSIEAQAALQNRDALRAQLQSPERTALLIRATHAMQQAEALAHNARWALQGSLTKMNSFQHANQLLEGLVIPLHLQDDFQSQELRPPQKKEFFEKCARALLILNSNVEKVIIVESISTLLHQSIERLKEERGEQLQKTHTESSQGDETDMMSLLSSVTGESPRPFKIEEPRFTPLPEQESDSTVASINMAAPPERLEPTPISHPDFSMAYTSMMSVVSNSNCPSHGMRLLQQSSISEKSNSIGRASSKTKKNRSKKNGIRNSFSPHESYGDQEFLEEGATAPLLSSTLEPAIQVLEKIYLLTHSMADSTLNLLEHRREIFSEGQQAMLTHLSVSWKTFFASIETQLSIICDDQTSINEASERLLQEWKKERQEPPALEDKEKIAQAHADRLLAELAQEENKTKKNVSQTNKKKRKPLKKSALPLVTEKTSSDVDNNTPKEERETASGCCSGIGTNIHQAYQEAALVISLIQKAEARQKGVDHPTETALFAIPTPPLTEEEEATLRNFAAEQREHPSLLTVLKGLYVLWQTSFQK